MDLSRFQLFNFDCYGTLIDWERGMLKALEPICAESGLAWSDESLLSAFAIAESAVADRASGEAFLPYREVLGHTLARMGESLGFRPSSTTRARFAASVGDWPVFEDTVASLKAIAKYGQLSILSNVDNDLFARTNELLGVDFDFVFTAEDIGSYKPSAANFDHLVEHSPVPKSEILHVAQSQYHDVGPASAMDLRCVWVNRRRGSSGTGATPASSATGDLEVPDLRSLAALVAESHAS
ncbi:MAG: 2-haloacid dehalogenase [Bacteroidia bacterium]|jgi:2-haloacid dehalogenase